jgi:hypothetical protein
VSQLLADRSDLRPSEQLVADLMPSARPPSALPNAEELIRSATKAT